jgi:hypothetical protein
MCWQAVIVRAARRDAIREPPPVRRAMNADYHSSFRSAGSGCGKTTVRHCSRSRLRKISQAPPSAMFALNPSLFAILRGAHEHWKNPHDH